MSVSPAVQDLLDRNKAIVPQFQPLNLSLAAGTKPLPMVAVVSCTDPRGLPEKIFGVTSNEVFMLRANGGRIETVFNDMLALDHFFGVTDIVILHHTDCGFSHMTQSNIHADLQRRFPEADPAYIDSLPFRTIDSLEQSVRGDIQFIHNSVLVKKELKDRTVGFIVDINTGQLTQVQGIVADAPQ
ncbi:carbonic anhydrase [Fusarium oxysporum f. sp. phaseoli]